MRETNPESDAFEDFKGTPDFAIRKPEGENWRVQVVTGRGEIWIRRNLRSAA